MEIKLAELYKMLDNNDKGFNVEFEKIRNKNITLMELDDDSNEYVKVDDYHVESIFVEEDEIGFDFGKEDYERVYLNETDIIKIN